MYTHWEATIGSSKIDTVEQKSLVTEVLHCPHSCIGKRSHVKWSLGSGVGDATHNRKFTCLVNLFALSRKFCFYSLLRVPSVQIIYKGALKIDRSEQLESSSSGKH